MARIVLLRHAHSVANEKNVLAGRTPGIALSKTGREQALQLVNRIGTAEFDEIAVSPMQRCRETIDPWLAAASAQSRVVVDESISEVDYGNWSGKSLASLRRKSQWKVVQEFPSQMVFPDGESILEMQGRALSGFYRLNSLKGRRPRLMVSHGDVIKSIVAHCLGMHLDQFQRLVIEPASITIIDTDEGMSRLVRFNDVKGFLKSGSSTTGTHQSALGGSTGNSDK
jgi:probable phosphomutase (TIGR03848 family)